MHKSRRVVVRNENRSGRGEGSEEWKVKSEEWKVNRGQWTVSGEQGSVIINHWRTLIIEHWSLNIDIGMRFFACVVGAICKSPYAVVCVFFSNRPCFQIAHVFNCPHVGGRIAHILRCASSRTLPLHVCFLDVRKYTCKYTKKHHGHGMDLFACVFSHVDGCVVSFVFQTLKIVKINTINKIKPISNEKIFIFSL